MNFVEKHSKLLAVALCLCASGPVLSTVHAYEVQPGWHTNGEVSYYVLDNHQRATGLVEVDGSLYYFNQNGEMQYGWQNIGNQTYYFDTNGKAITGKAEIQGTTYNFQQSGALSQGWNSDGSYYNEKGFKVASTWVYEDGSKYYFDENGQQVSSTWKDIEGGRYYFDENGQVSVGTLTVDGAEYTTDDQGVIQTGWIEQDGATYYYNEDGSKNLEAVKEIDGYVYNFAADGSLIVPDQTVVETPAEPEVVVPEVVTPAEPEVVTPEVVAPAEPEVVTPEVVAPAEPEVATPEVVAPAEPEVVTPEVVAPAEPEVVTPEVVTPAEPEVVTPEVVAPAEPEVTTPEVVTPAEPEQDAWIDTTPDYVEEETTTTTPSTTSSKADIIYAAALAQLGVNQDCTMLATNSLAAAGIYFHGWPEEYTALGDWTSNPVPGDLVIYSGHIAVYAGNGQAVHGGWFGYQTVLYSVNCANALLGYIHVR
jgi:glucan-binding YG repeat protein